MATGNNLSSNLSFSDIDENIQLAISDLRQLFLQKFDQLESNYRILRNNYESVLEENKELRLELYQLRHANEVSSMEEVRTIDERYDREYGNSPQLVGLTLEENKAGWIQWFIDYKQEVITSKEWISKNELLNEVNAFIKVLLDLDLSEYNTYKYWKLDQTLPFPSVNLFTNIIGFELFTTLLCNQRCGETSTTFIENSPFYNIVEIELLNMQDRSILPEAIFRGSIISPQNLDLLNGLQNRNPFLQTIMPQNAPLLSTSESLEKASRFATRHYLSNIRRKPETRSIIWKYNLVQLDENFLQQMTWLCPKSKLLSTIYNIQLYSEYSSEKEWILKSHPLQIMSVDEGSSVCEVQLGVLNLYLHHIDNERDEFIFWIMKNYCIVRELNDDIFKIFEEGLTCLKEDLMSAVPTDDPDPLNRATLLRERWLKLLQSSEIDSTRFRRWVGNFYDAKTSTRLTM